MTSKATGLEEVLFLAFEAFIFIIQELSEESYSF
jgi:hypothetical protein